MKPLSAGDMSDGDDSSIVIRADGSSTIPRSSSMKRSRSSPGSGLQRDRGY